MLKKLFTSQDVFEIQAVRSELDALSIPYMVKNEYAAGAIGELPWQDAQPELWLVDDSWYARASLVIERLLTKDSTGISNPRFDWVCDDCGEENGEAFDICWFCSEGKRPSGES